MHVPIITALLLLLTVNSKSFAVALDDAWQQINNKNYLAAEEILRKHISQYPNATDELFLLARVFAWNKKFAESEQVFTQLSTKYPHNVDYMLANARVLYWQNKLSESLRLIEQCKKLAPEYDAVVALENDVMAAIKASQSKAKSKQNKEGIIKKAVKLATKLITAKTDPNPKKLKQLQEDVIKYMYLNGDIETIQEDNDFNLIDEKAIEFLDKEK